MLVSAKCLMTQINRRRIIYLIETFLLVISRCSQPAVLGYSQGKGKVGKPHQPFYQCASVHKKKCNYFKWAFQAQLMHWYRFGAHNGHTLVHTGRSFSADDLVQGKVGDCWFLSALAVIAERSDLIQRLFPIQDPVQVQLYQMHGMVQVKLFMDGYWKTITMDTFLPCLMEFQGVVSSYTNTGRLKNSSSSMTDPNALSNDSRKQIEETKAFLLQDREKKIACSRLNSNPSVGPIQLMRPVNSNDLAYSKCQLSQLWVPFLEKAYGMILSVCHFSCSSLILYSMECYWYALYSQDSWQLQGNFWWTNR